MLYEVITALGSDVPFFLQSGPAITNTMTAVADANADSIPRITSYNVCYTKLLRPLGVP